MGDLAVALEHAEMLVYYQPILAREGHSVRSRARGGAQGGARDAGPAGSSVAAVEALLRWRCAPGVVLPAADFIDSAISSGLIHSIGRWLIDQTCEQLREWQDELGNRAPATAFVNLCGPELALVDLPSALGAALERHRLEPQCLGLEIVEEDLSSVELLPQLVACHDRGHPLAVDDFGTGYSSLSRLLDLPVDLVKMDRSFLQDVPQDQRRAALIDAVLGVADSLDLQVIAEGVETEEQFTHLTAAGCQLLQGFYLGRPRPGAELSRTLRKAPPPEPRAARWAASEHH